MVRPFYPGGDFETFPYPEGCVGVFCTETATVRCFDQPTELTLREFAALIDRVSGRGTWERNPYVFAYEFKLVK